MLKLRRDEMHTLTGAYALDAIDGGEKARFERHLRGCHFCDHEVHGLQATAAQLGVAVAVEPPPELKQQILTAAARTRQLPPARERTTHRAPSRRLMPRLAAGVTAVAVAAAVVAGVAWSRTQDQLSQAQAQNQAIAAVLAQPGARVVTGHVTGGGTATVVLASAQRKLIFTTEGLAPLPSGKVYQLWLINKVVRSEGLLPAASSGRTAPVLAAGLQAGDHVGVTVEPAGGSKQPTTNPILNLKLPTALS
jgi:anti-sigma-K factor RskA